VVELARLVCVRVGLPAVSARFQVRFIAAALSAKLGMLMATVPVGAVRLPEESKVRLPLVSCVDVAPVSAVGMSTE